MKRKSAAQRQAELLESHFMRMHEYPPMAFNLDARPGLHEAVSAAQSEYWERNPNSTREEAKKHYADTYERLRPSFPSHRERMK